MSFVVAAHSPAWPRLFLVLRDELQTAFAATHVDIEHIGSTAVAGLSAKPVIDILVGAASLADIEARIPALQVAGYDYVSRYESELPMRRYFVKSPPDSLRVHVHAVVRGGDHWHDHLAFRDALRTDADLRERYQALKLDLAQRFAHDKSAYTEAKGPFIRDAITASANGVRFTSFAK
jgi:GrpB-like predicted nucleotidyltransferase (UPF0157 family)